MAVLGIVGSASGLERAAPAPRFVEVSLQVPSGEDAAPFDAERSVTVPAGWSAAVWARVPGARFLLWTPEGNLLVTAAQSGEVIELSPGRNGAAPRQRVLVSGLTEPQGLALDSIQGTRFLYVAESDQIDRFRLRPDGTPTSRTIVVGGLPDADAAGDDVHRLKSLAVGPDHAIYVNVGSADNAQPRPSSPPRATILAYRPDGTGMRVIAQGVRNGEGLAFAPDGALWTAVNGRDQIPYPFHGSFGGDEDAYGQVITAYVNEHPPDELARLTPGRNLGWPFCNPDPDVAPGNPATPFRYARLPFDNDVQTNPSGTILDCSKLAPLDRGLPAHSAPLGLTFLEGSRIASPWSKGAVLAVHGSWDRTPPRAPAVLWLPWLSAQRTLGAPITLLGGFQDASGARWGRPTDAAPGPDGRLYVADDQAGAIYRLGPPVPS